ncbi:hypothetical protein PSPO01_04305 [Paraphaeosphaeria sporulosa]
MLEPPPVFTGTVDTRETDELALVGVLGDLYPHFVETGFIEQDRETLKSLERVDEDFLSVTIENKDKNGLFTVDKICAAIEATGFDSPSALAVVCSRQDFPVKKLRNTQPRNYVPALVCGHPHATTDGTKVQATSNYHELCKAYKERRKEEMTQNPFGDNIGALSKPASDKTEAMKTLMEVQSIAAAQHVEGDVEVVQLSFLPRYPTDAACDWKYIGSEHSEVWRYAEATEGITIWSLEQDGWSTGAQLSTLDYAHNQQEHGKSTVVAVRVLCSSPHKDVEGLE